MDYGVGDAKVEESFQVGIQCRVPFLALIPIISFCHSKSHLSGPTLDHSRFGSCQYRLASSQVLGPFHGFIVKEQDSLLLGKCVEEGRSSAIAD